MINNFNYMIIFKKITFLLVILYATVSFSQVKLPSFFSSNMVLQQNTSVSIWGTDKPKVEIEVIGSWGEKVLTKTDKSGNWKVKLKTPIAGKTSYNISIKGSNNVILNDVLIGEVWLCSGQSNMAMALKGFNFSPITNSNETILNAKNNNIRFFTTERNASLELENNVTGEWQVASPLTVKDFSATAYFFAKKIESILDIPIGLIHTSWGGSKVEAWMDVQTLANFKSIKLPESIPKKQQNQTPSLLYNAMIHPFVGYGIKGVIWYQGESNVIDPKGYKELFPAMIKSWRENWNQGDFPFYFVEIAPFNYKQGNSAFLRESQLQTMQTVLNTGMVTTIDLGNCNNIHPSEKEPIGNRLAYLALSETYGVKGIGYNGPLYNKMEIVQDAKIKLYFDFVPNGLFVKGNELSGFEIAGEDKVFYPAKAQIKRDKTVEVWSETVTKPVAVRYAFNNCVEGSLYNTEGLPASSFRTDNWEN